MQVVGEQIKLARLCRNLSVAQVAERATCSPLAVSRIEKGTPTVAIGIYFRVLYALQLDDIILSLDFQSRTILLFCPLCLVLSVSGCRGARGLIQDFLFFRMGYLNSTIDDG